METIIATDDNIRVTVIGEIRDHVMYSDLNYIDVSRVTDFYDLFNTICFNGDISKWDMSNAESTRFMFGGSGFQGDISNWDMSNVKDVSFMFQVLSYHGDLSKWRLNPKIILRGMFQNSQFNGDISKWFDPDKVSREEKANLFSVMMGSKYTGMFFRRMLLKR